MGFANSSRSFCLDTRYVTFKPNFLRPQFVRRNSSGVLREHKKRPLSTGTVSEIHRGIPEMTYKSQHARGCSLTLLLQLVIHHHTMCTGNSLRSTSWHQSKQLYGQNIGKQKVTISFQHKALKASLWDYVNLIIPFSSSAALQKHFRAQRCETLQIKLQTRRWIVLFFITYRTGTPSK